MNIGVGYAAHVPAPTVIAAARTAERLGFSTFWVTDSHLTGREVFTLLGAIAVSTQRITLATGVSHLAGRHPSIHASALATLDELAPGRIRLGIGVGDSGANNLGVPRASLAELEHAVTGIRALLNGDETPGPGSAPLRLTYAPTQRAVPIYVAGAGERLHRLSGRIADGALLSTSPGELKRAIESVRAGEREAGRPAGATKILLWTTVSVDEDASRARAAVRGAVARRAVNALARGAKQGTLDPEDQRAFDQLQRAYETHRHGTTGAEALADLVPEPWIDRFAIAGSPATVRERLEQAQVDGADEIGMILLGSNPADRGSPDLLERFAEIVMAQSAVSP